MLSTRKAQNANQSPHRSSIESLKPDAKRGRYSTLTFLYADQVSTLLRFEFTSATSVTRPSGSGPVYLLGDNDFIEAAAISARNKPSKRSMRYDTCCAYGFDHRRRRQS
jgi:hypothetical protein